MVIKLVWYLCGLVDTADQEVEDGRGDCDCCLAVGCTGPKLGGIEDTTDSVV